MCVCVLCRELQQTLQSVETIQEEKNSLSKTTEELQTILLVRFHALLYINVPFVLLVCFFMTVWVVCCADTTRISV